MDVKQREQISHAVQILSSIRDLCVVLQSPEIKDIPLTVFLAVEVGLDAAKSLLDLAVGMEDGGRKGGDPDCRGQ